MERFIKKVVAISLIIVVIVASINALFIKLNGANADATNKFAYIPVNLDVCNFGSSHGLYGYNYADYSDKYGCFNFGLSSQSLSYDYRLFQNYESHIGRGTVVFITVSYFSLFGKGEIYGEGFQSKNKRYYTILPSNMIKEYDFKTDVFVRYLPSLAVDTKALVETLLGKRKSDKNDEDWRRLAGDIDVDKDAKAAYKRHILTDKYDTDGTRIVNQEEIEALYNLIYACQKKGATPILVTTPYLQEYLDIVKEEPGFYDQFYYIVNQVVAETGVKYYDYAFDERFTHNYDWLMNADHLNKEGARQFVDILMNEIVFKNNLLKN